METQDATDHSVGRVLPDVLAIAARMLGSGCWWSKIKIDMDRLLYVGGGKSVVVDYDRKSAMCSRS